jgi:photosystem II stability/assembly factor-like uncharacterized protein
MHIVIPRHLVLASLAAIGMAGCSENSAPDPVTAPDLHRVHGPAAFTLTEQQSGTTSRLQAISAVNDRVVWASGVGGSYTVTTDGGRTWQAGVVPGADALQFRDVEAISAREAYLMAAGSGTDSRIYKTTDGGRHWRLQFQNTDPDAFYDCFAFWGRDRGITTSDAVNGRFPVIRTRDGEHWKDIGGNLPAAQAGEASFAASGTCVAVAGERHAWIGTGGAAQARILATTDGGQTWNAYGTPIVQGTPSAGVITLAFRDTRHGILAGGDLAITDDFTDNVATSDDGGRTWDLANHPTFTGSVYGLAYTSHFGKAVVATGPKGAAWSPDEGQSWFAMDSTVHDYWAVTFASPDAGWLVGTEGRILKVSFPDHRWGWH